MDEFGIFREFFIESDGRASSLEFPAQESDGLTLDEDRHIVAASASLEHYPLRAGQVAGPSKKLNADHHGNTNERSACINRSPISGMSP